MQKASPKRPCLVLSGQKINGIYWPCKTERGAQKSTYIQNMKLYRNVHNDHKPKKQKWQMQVLQPRCSVNGRRSPAGFCRLVSNSQRTVTNGRMVNYHEQLNTLVRSSLRQGQVGFPNLVRLPREMVAKHCLESVGSWRGMGRCRICWGSLFNTNAASKPSATGFDSHSANGSAMNSNES